MSYIPDYRQETDKLNDKDQSYIAGYRHAMENALSFFENAADLYKLSPFEQTVIERAKEFFEDWMDSEETDTVCSLFDNADYLPEDIELKDANTPHFQNTKGANQRP